MRKISTVIGMILCSFLLSGCGVAWFPGQDTPSAFTFTAVANTDRNVIVLSNTVTVAGFFDPAGVTITGGEYAINGGAFTSAPGTINPGQTLQVRHTSDPGYGIPTTTTITVGKFSTTFVSTTAALNTIPNAFSFISPTFHLPATFTLYSSNAVTITGINAPSPISITGAGTYSIDGTASTAVTINNNQIVKIFHAMPVPGKYLSTLTVGGIFASYSTTRL